MRYKAFDPHIYLAGKQQNVLVMPKFPHDMMQYRYQNGFELQEKRENANATLQT